MRALAYLPRQCDKMRKVLDVPGCTYAVYAVRVDLYMPEDLNYVRLR